MLRLLAHENFNGSIIRGLLRRKPEVDVVRDTVPKYAYERIVAGLPMAGVFIGDTYLPVQQAIEDLLLLVERSEEHEWEGQVRFLPL
jgi:hypothetical protein